MRELTDTLPVAVYTTDVAGRITHFNEAAASLWGRRPVLGEDRWCGSWRLYSPDGTPMRGRTSGEGRCGLIGDGVAARVCRCSPKRTSLAELKITKALADVCRIAASMAGR